MGSKKARVNFFFPMIKWERVYTPSLSKDFFHPPNGSSTTSSSLQTCTPHPALSGSPRAPWPLQSWDLPLHTRPLSLPPFRTQSLRPPCLWPRCSPPHLLERAPWCPVLCSVSRHWRRDWSEQACAECSTRAATQAEKWNTPSCLPPGGKAVCKRRGWGQCSKGEISRHDMEHPGNISALVLIPRLIPYSYHCIFVNYRSW